MTHYYRHQWQRPSLEELAKIREVLAEAQVLQPYVAPIGRPKFERQVFELKLSYTEYTQRPYKSEEELRRAIDGGVV